MNSDGNVLINAPRGIIWKILTDADFVVKFKPGVREIVGFVPNVKYQPVTGPGNGCVATNYCADMASLELATVDRAKVKVHGKTR